MAESVLYTGKLLVNDESAGDGGIPAYLDPKGRDRTGHHEGFFRFQFV